MMEGRFDMEKPKATLNGSTATQLKEAIARAIEENAAWTHLAIAQNIVGAFPSMIEAWVLGEITRLVRLARGKAPNPLQTYFEGFTTLDARLPLDQGYKPLRLATITDLRQSLRVMLAKQASKPNKKLEALQAMIDRLAPFAAAKHGITVEEYVQLAAMGTPPPEVRRAELTEEERRSIAKERWKAIPKKKRREIAQKRVATRKRRRGQA